jgi:large-conductance mechanosensitive channel
MCQEVITSSCSSLVTTLIDDLCASAVTALAHRRDAENAEVTQRTVKAMLDVVFIAATVGFFVIALAYVYACERLRGGKDEG